MEKIGVIGAGNMGAGMAQKYASSGFIVVVVDIAAAAAAKGRERVKAKASCKSAWPTSPPSRLLPSSPSASPWAL